MTKVTIVDEHHHAMKPYWKKQPKKDTVLLHFDSHPDMAPSADMSKASVQCLCAHKCTNRSKLLEENSIETWIPTLVLEGYVNCVIWVCGPWCTQMPEGVYPLLVGTYKNRVKVARNDGKEDYLPYFGDDEVPPSQLSCSVPWVLHVMKSVNVRQIRSILKDKPFTLDIDEDYFSVNNPFGERIRQYFGASVHAIVEKLGKWNVYDEPRYLKELRSIIQGRKSSGDMDNLVRKRGNPYKMAKHLVNKDTKHFKELLVDAIRHTHLPHHITPMGDILTMLYAIEKLLKRLPKPRLITVATSRRDEYTPELQALDMYDHTIAMFERAYGRVQVERLDKVDGLSVE